MNIVVILTCHGKELYFVFIHSDTALIEAAGSWRGDNTEAVQILLAAGADIKHRNKQG